MPFQPKYSITPALASMLMRIEAARHSIISLPLTPSVLASLQETAKLRSTHYSTAIEGNRLTQEQVTEVLIHEEHFPGRARDEREVLGYYVALEKVEQLASRRAPIAVSTIQTLHALVMAEGRRRAKPTPFRDGQNVIRDQASNRIVYLPPEAKNVPLLMKELVSWIADTANSDVPIPLRAGIAHYQFATIHPYYDGNGRTARLLTTLILHLGGYDLKGIYSLEEYYARSLHHYYEALNIGPSHNYYGGRAEADITKWVVYFCEGMADSFESVAQRAVDASKKGERDLSEMMRQLDARQRKVLALFERQEFIAATDVARLFRISPRTARHLCRGWVDSGFLVVANPAKKTRTYALARTK